ncbi:hypothetical protein [Burkholderia contaminans]|uniref:Uncharacterized protein n=1 Tax=Burkholderia contaminans TaxID=488447 RepID=A0A2S5DMD0_9BURK|nr:hypothetical protein [Burkholderia contaminans]POZ80246.1 hypothetical protein C3743_40450 [Burkholderia contaminans]
MNHQIVSKFFDTSERYFAGVGDLAMLPINVHLSGERRLTTSAADSVAALRDVLRPYRFRFVDERELQDGIEKVLAGSLRGYKREAVLGPADRPDFLLDDGVAIEVKVDGSLAELLRQVSRYASHDSVRAILVVGTPYWIAKIPSEIGGKPLVGLRLVASLL